MIKESCNIAEFIYLNGAVESIITPEGRAVKSGSTFYYEYNLTDHLGNVRATYKDNGSGIALQLQETHYYPFGLAMQALTFNSASATSPNKYLFGSKELNTDFSWMNYDFGARYYDPAIARWHCLDPKASSYPDLSPYNYCANNPINYVDPNGESFLAVLAGIAISAAISYVASGLDNWINKDMSFKDSFSPKNCWIVGGTEITIPEKQQSTIPNDPYGSGGNSSSSGILSPNKSEVLARKAVNEKLKQLANNSVPMNYYSLNNFNKKYYSSFKYFDQVTLVISPETVNFYAPNACGFAQNRFYALTETYPVYLSYPAFISGSELFLTLGHEYVHIANIIETGRSFNRNLSEHAAYMWEYKILMNSGYSDYADVRKEKANGYFEPTTGVMDRFLTPYRRYNLWNLPRFVPEELRTW